MRNNRKNNELREIKFTRNYTKHALGSVLVEFGDTKVIVTASVDEKQPRWMKDDENKGWITAEYSLLPGSTHTRVDRERGIRLSGRTQEIQRLIGRSLRACVDLNKLGPRTITIDADVIQADGGTRTASISGGYVALVDAINKLIKDEKLEQSPIIQPIAAISAGIVEGEIRLDLEYEEDSQADVDSNIVMMEDGSLVEFQATSEGAPYTQEQMFEMLKMSENGIKKIIELQKEALQQE
ncbi:MAG: ribonuclease PH [Candidatus Gastranaerophilales bacterium]|nr:ribonuclease PH [Candidatus Gastranaerophilales bacterium]